MTSEPQEITTRDVVLGLDRKVDELARDVADIKIIAGTVGSNVSTLIDHEQRLRALERFRYGIPSATIVLMALTVLVALAALFYSVFGRSHAAKTPGVTDPHVLSIPHKEKRMLTAAGFAGVGSIVLVVGLAGTIVFLQRNYDGSAPRS